MTEIVIKKRKTLSLKPKPAPKKEECQPKPSGAERLAENNRKQEQERQRNYHACKAWIFSTWPEIFNREDVKPLELGIGKKIIAEYDRAGGAEALGFGRTLQIGRVLKGWTQRKAYLRALSQEGAFRYDLNSQVVEEVSPEHCEKAKRQLEEKKRMAKVSKKKA
ncbi:hypothetical protein ONF92_004601 [Vibrio parahaemolyticus]|nr:hypothetical protein [Vibrio parahaemolyticus]EME0136079.1 hypothetical protein [Vibrio parahaemolyticus]